MILARERILLARFSELYELRPLGSSAGAWLENFAETGLKLPADFKA